MFLFSTCQPTWSFIYPHAELSPSRASPQNLPSARSSASCTFIYVAVPPHSCTSPSPHSSTPGLIRGNMSSSNSREWTRRSHHLMSYMHDTHAVSTSLFDVQRNLPPSINRVTTSPHPHPLIGYTLRLLPIQHETYPRYTCGEGIHSHASVFLGLSINTNIAISTSISHTRYPLNLRTNQIRKSISTKQKCPS